MAQRRGWLGLISVLTLLGLGDPPVVVDAPMFLFRFYYGDLEQVEFRCDTKEIQESQARVEIRDLFLNFATETTMKTVPAK